MERHATGGGAFVRIRWCSGKDAGLMRSRRCGAPCHVEAIPYQEDRFPTLTCRPIPPKEAAMLQPVRQCVGTAKYVRYTLGSLSAVLFVNCAGGS
jgi:hypothetical protein